MWKKSGAWFYREMPNYTKPADAPLFLNSGDIGGDSVSPFCNGLPYLTGAGTSGTRSPFVLPVVYGSGQNSPQFSTNSPNQSSNPNRWRSSNSAGVLGRRSINGAQQNDAYDKISMYEGDDSRSVSTQKDNIIPSLASSSGVFGLGGNLLRMQNRNTDIVSNGTLPIKQLPIPTDQQQRY